MRKSKIIYFVFAALLPLFLLGCAAGQAQADKPEDHAPGEDWKVGYIELGAGGGGKILGLAKTEKGMFARFGSAGQSDEGYPLYYLSDEKLRQTASKQDFEGIFIDMQWEHQPFCQFADQGETLYLLAFCDTEEEKAWYLYKVDARGGDVQCVDITAAWTEAFGEEGTVVVAAADESGFVYVGRKGGPCRILILKEDGSLAFVLQQQEVELCDLAAADGQVYCVGRSGGTDSLFRVDGQGKELEKVAALPDGRGTVMLRSGQGHTVLYGYYDAVYQYDLEKGQGENVYVWTNAGLEGRNVKDFFTDEQGNLWVLPDLKDDVLIMMLLQKPSEKGEDEGVSERETVVICGDRADAELSKAVGGFNAANDKYRVEIMDYDADRLMAEIIAGNGPDLFPLDVLGVSMSVRKGIVEDLNPYLEASGVLSRDMLNEKVLDLYTVDGKLSCIPPSFYISTLFGKASELGSEPGWTMEEFLDYVDSHRGLTVMEGTMKGDSRKILVMMMWTARQQQWVDWKQGEAKFDGEEFGELFRFAAAYEARYDEEDSSAESKWQEGKLLLYSRPVIGMKHYLTYREVMSGDMVAIGFPTKEGEPCHELGAYGVYGISSASTHKEGAWAFIEYLASSQTGKNTYHYGIATLNSAMEDMLAQAAEGGSSMMGYDFPAATDEDIRQFRQLIDHSTVRGGDMWVVNTILTEEMDVCFLDGRSVEDTIDIIQTRVQLYLDEN